MSQFFTSGDQSIEVSFSTSPSNEYLGLRTGNIGSYKIYLQKMLREIKEMQIDMSFKKEILLSVIPWMNLEGIKLNKTSQLQKNKHSIILLT